MAFGGDGLISAVAGALKHTDGVVGILPGGRGNDLCRVLGIPLKPVAACGVLATGRASGGWISGEADGHAFAGIASCGFDSDGQPDRQRDDRRARQPRVRVRAAEGARRLEAAGFEVGSTASAAAVHRLLGRRGQLEAVYGGGM